MLWYVVLYHITVAQKDLFGSTHRASPKPFKQKTRDINHNKRRIN